MNACLDRARKAASRKTAPVDDTERLEQLLEPHESASAPAERNDLHRQLIEAMGTLPPDQRAALVLVDMQGYPVAEAARVLDVPTGTVKSRCARGRARLLPLLTHLRPGAPVRWSTEAGDGTGKGEDIRPTRSGSTATGPTRHRNERPGCSEGRRWASVTSTNDKAEHPDVAEISDLTEGLLPADRRDAVRRHLDRCELCADVHASLEDIRGLLGTVPGPPRMPADVAGRIDAALAAEALLHATAPVTDGEDENVTAGTAAADGAPLHVSRETSAPSSDRPAGRPRSSTTGPGRKPRLRARSRRAAVLGAAFAVAALGLGSVVLSSLNGGGGPDDEQRTTTAADTFSEGKLEEQVNDLLARNPEQDKGARSPIPSAWSRIPPERTPGC